MSGVDISVSVGLLECSSGESGVDGSGGGGGGGGIVRGTLGGSGGGLIQPVLLTEGGWCGTGGVLAPSPSRSAGESKDDIEKHFQNSIKLKDMNDTPLK